MIKTFKKALAIMMTFIFVMSLVPAGVMAEGEDSAPKIPLTNGYYGNGSSDYDYSTLLRAHTVADGATPGGYQAFFQINFSGYEYLLADPDTSLKLYMGTQTSSSSFKTGDFRIFAIDDDSDGYTAITHATSTTNLVPLNKVSSFLSGKVKWDTPFVIRSDATVAAAPGFEIDAEKSVVINSLNAATDDSIVTFQFVPGPKGTSASNPNRNGFMHSTSYVQINSASENATPENYLKTISKELSWAVLSSQNIKYVTKAIELPTKYKGVEIDWESSNEDALNSSSGEVVINPATNTYVTLTANLKYTDYNQNSVTTPKEFKVRIPGDAYDYSISSGTYYDASTEDVPEMSTSGNDHSIIIDRIGGFAGKEKSDLCYEITDASGNQRFNLTSPSTDATLRDTIEFSVCIPDGCHGLSTFISLYKNFPSTSSHGTSSSSFTYHTDGIYRGGSLLIPWDGNKWHNVAIVAPGIVSSDADNGIVYDRRLKVYVDGVLELDEDINEKTDGAYPQPYGVRYCQVNGLSTYDSTSKTFNGVAYYLDNLRWTNDPYKPAYNTKSSVVTNFDIDHDGETITLVTSGTTAGDVINSLTIDEDATPRMYDSEWNLLDDDVVLSDGCMLVVADTNGTTSERSYAYYEIRVMEAGDIAFDVPFINLDSGAVKGNVKVFNYSGEDKTYKVFLAIYDGGEFIGITDFEELTAEDGKITEFTTEGSLTFASGNKAKLFVWENDEITPKLASVSYK